MNYRKCRMCNKNRVTSSEITYNLTEWEPKTAFHPRRTLVDEWMTPVNDSVRFQMLPCSCYEWENNGGVSAFLLISRAYSLP